MSKVVMVESADGKMQSNAHFDYCVILFLLAFTCVVFILNYYISGPMIHADEGSYLANSAAIAGYSNDLASSYSAGYSIFISPAFLFGADPEHVWLYVRIVNAVLFLALTLGVWRLAHAQLVPVTSSFDRLSSILIVSAYPMWVVMAGYAFAQLAFASVFVWSVFFLRKSLLNSRFSFFTFSLLISFLYWIHPTGVVVIVAGLVSAFILSLLRRSVFFVSAYIVTVATGVALYKYGFQPWLYDRMTIGGDPALHYPSLFRLLTPLTTIDGITDVVARSGGHLFYLVLGTAGLFWIGVEVGAAKILTALRSRSAMFGPAQDWIVHIFLLLSLLGVLVLSVLFFASDPNAVRIDHWMYGRYVEGVIAPTLLVGALCFTRVSALRAILVAIGAASLLSFGISDYSHTARFNIPAFWQDFYIRGKGVWWWLVYGIAVVLTIAVAGRTFGRFLIWILFVACGYLQIAWHEKAALEASQRWEVATYVRENVVPGACVGFDFSGIDSYYRHVFWFDFGFQLFDYRYQRVEPKRWAQGECDGPLFSYSSNVNKEFEVEAYVAAVSPRGGPLLWVRESHEWVRGTQDAEIYPLNVADRSAGLGRVLRQGWHGMEAAHIWSSEAAVLLLPVPDQCSRVACYAEIGFGVFGASSQRPVEVDFEVRGQKTADSIGNQIYSNPGPFNFRVRLDGSERVSEVVIKVPSATSPNKLAGAPDQRVLGIALHSINLIHD